MKKPSLTENGKENLDESLENNLEFIDSQELSNNPDFLKLLDLYQQAEFDKCSQIIDRLLLKFPSNQKLNWFRKDLDIQLSLRNISKKQTQETKQKRVKNTGRMTLFSIVGSIIVLIVFSVSFLLLGNNVSKKQLEENQQQLNSLEIQVQHLLLTGQPEVAANLVKKMHDIDVNYEGLENLTSQVEKLLVLHSRYQYGLELFTNEAYDDALKIFEEVDKEHPGLWDVQQKIILIETLIERDKLLDTGNQAYQSGKWQETIDAYELAMRLDPNFDDGIMSEQLLNSYLRTIISMLESESTTIQDIELAEDYYRKAVSMVPQNRAFAFERENLREVSSNLLELKFTQTAKNLLENRNQTINSISQAVSYFAKAYNLNPKNASLQSQLRNAQLYQIGFKNFIEMNWGPAIENLAQLQAVDRNYANGNVNLLLYDAYYLYGKQYFSVGLYVDARSYFELAEILAWEDSENLMKLFQVQVKLGDTIGLLRDYQNAVSYYQYALTAIKIYSRVYDHIDLAEILYEAESLANQGNFQDAFSAYQNGLSQINRIYQLTEVEIEDGTCLTFFADEHSSTTEAIVNENNLTNSMLITFGKKLVIPTIEK